MKTWFVIILVIFCASCGGRSDKYFMDKHSKLLGLAGASYVLAERKGDSLQLWYISEDINAGFFERSESEMLPYKPAKGKNFEIIAITNTSILGVDWTLHGVSNTKNYFRLRNEVAANVLEGQFNDSIKNILQVAYKNISFGHMMYDREEKSEIISNLHCDTFPGKYRHYLQSNLEKVKLKAVEKEKFHTAMVNGQVALDSVTFAKFIDHYSYGYYDRQTFYHFIKQKPELFFLEIYLGGVDTDVMECPECFTKEELDEMYCKLKPFRSKDPKKLWMFERHGDLKCQKE